MNKENKTKEVKTKPEKTKEIKPEKTEEIKTRENPENSENSEKALKKQWYRRKEREYNKEYYQKNKIKLLEDQKIKVCCPKCNRVVIKSNLNKHLKTNLCTNTQELNKFILENK